MCCNQPPDDSASQTIFEPFNHWISPPEHECHNKKSPKDENQSMWFVEDKQKHITPCPHHARCIFSKININKSIFKPRPIVGTVFGWFYNALCHRFRFVCVFWFKSTHNRRSAVEGACRMALCERWQKTFHNNAMSLVVENCHLLIWAYTKRANLKNSVTFHVAFFSLTLYFGLEMP